MDIMKNITDGAYEVKVDRPKHYYTCECGRHHSWDRGLTKYCDNCGRYIEKLMEEGLEQRQNKMLENSQIRSKAHTRFRNDLIIYVGMNEHPKRDAVFEMAWDLGHSSSLIEVVNYMEKLANLIRG